MYLLKYTHFLSYSLATASSPQDPEYGCELVDLRLHQLKAASLQNQPEQTRIQTSISKKLLQSQGIKPRVFTAKDQVTIEKEVIYSSVDDASNLEMR